MGRPSDGIDTLTHRSGSDGATLAHADNLLRAPPLPARCDPARGLAVPALHLELPRCRGSVGRARVEVGQETAEAAGLCADRHRQARSFGWFERIIFPCPRRSKFSPPNSIPTFTYVDRKKRGFEERLREVLTIPNMIVSLSGPSKSGKTVLVSKVIDPNNLIPLSGASIRSVDDLWSNALAWMGSPTTRVETVGSKVAIDMGATAGGKVGIPLVAQGKLEVTGNLGGERSRDTAETFEQSSLHQVIKEIGGSDFVVFEQIGHVYHLAHYRCRF
jgi:hypothetical protein